jgi:hypothetical protein
VFRAALLSVVLALTAGQDAALFCAVWCHSGEAMAGECEHQTQASSPGIIVSDRCQANSPVIVFVREDARGYSPAPNVQGGVIAPWFAFTPPILRTRSSYEPDTCMRLESRPLVLSLRI